MREIKFRGREWNGDDFVYGSLLVEDHNFVAIMPKDSVATIQVDPGTVGQFIGVLDSEKTEIFEGDIIEIEDGYTLKPSRHEVRYFSNDNYPAFDLHPNYDEDSNSISSAKFQASVRVIGNVHDNQDLLEG